MIYVVAWVVGDARLPKAFDDCLIVDLLPRADHGIAKLLIRRLLPRTARHEDLRPVVVPLATLVV